METGYALFSLEPGTKKEFVKKVKDIKGVEEAHLVIGIFDALVKIEAEDIQELERIYFNEIDKMEGITSSRLHFVACPRTRK